MAYGVPLDLILSLLECAGTVYFYGLILDLEGEWLQAPSNAFWNL